MDKIEIMVVDSSSLMRRTISTIVEARGHKVVASAKAANEALRLYHRWKPDIVTMDITLPDMNGLECSKRILEIDPQALIVIVTDIAQEDIVLESATIGVKGYVVKPVESKELVRTIENVYNSKNNPEMAEDEAYHEDKAE